MVAANTNSAESRLTNHRSLLVIFKLVFSSWVKEGLEKHWLKRGKAQEFTSLPNGVIMWIKKRIPGVNPDWKTSGGQPWSMEHSQPMSAYKVSVSHKLIWGPVFIPKTHNYPFLSDMPLFLSHLTLKSLWSDNFSVQLPKGQLGILTHSQGVDRTMTSPSPFLMQTV